MVNRTRGLSLSIDKETFGAIVGNVFSKAAERHARMPVPRYIAPDNVHNSVVAGDLEKVNELIDRDFQLNICNVLNALDMGNIDIAETLLENGNVNISDKWQVALAHAILSPKQGEAVALCMKHGGDFQKLWNTLESNPDLYRATKFDKEELGQECQRGKLEIYFQKPAPQLKGLTP